MFLQFDFPIFRGESHIDFFTQYVIMTLGVKGGGGGGGVITNDVLKFKKKYRILNFKAHKLS